MAILLINLPFKLLLNELLYLLSISSITLLKTYTNFILNYFINLFVNFEFVCMSDLALRFRHIIKLIYNSFKHWLLDLLTLDIPR